MIFMTFWLSGKNRYDLEDSQQTIKQYTGLFRTYRLKFYILAVLSVLLLPLLYGVLSIHLLNIYDVRMISTSLSC